MKSMIFSMLLIGCAPTHIPPAYTKQNLEKASNINQGMSQQDVKGIMGDPIKVEFSDNKIAWHYCRTGSSSDEFYTIVFTDGKVTKMKSYGVTSRDVGGASGDCSKFVRPYDFDKADNINEIRVKEEPNH